MVSNVFTFYEINFLQISYICGLMVFRYYCYIVCIFINVLLLSYWYLRYKIIDICLFYFFHCGYYWMCYIYGFVLFYAYFEGIVIPMFLLIVFEEAVVGRLCCLSIFFIYLFGSVFVLLCFLSIHFIKDRHHFIFFCLLIFLRIDINFFFINVFWIFN